MIQISAEIQIGLTLKRGIVYYFIEPTFNTEVPHYFVVLNDAPHTDEAMVMVCATSKIETVRNYISQRDLPLGTCVEVSQGEYPAFSVDTAFNCNTPITYHTKASLSLLLAQNRLRLCESPMPEPVLRRLCMGVTCSPVVERKFQNMIRI